MGTVELRFQPWLSEALGSPADRPLVLQEALQAGDTLRSVLMRIVSQRPGAAERLYRPGTSHFREEVAVVLNGRLIDLLPGKMDTELQDGDQVLLFPGFSGG